MNSFRFPKKKKKKPSFLREASWKDCGKNISNAKPLVIKMTNVRKGKSVVLGIKSLEMLEVTACLIK